MKSFWNSATAVSARLSAAPALLVTLDFDGTLAALAETPGQARLEPEFRSALRKLAALPGVHEALVLASERVAYLKVDMQGFDEERVVQLLGGEA